MRMSVMTTIKKRFKSIPKQTVGFGTIISFQIKVWSIQSGQYLFFNCSSLVGDNIFIEGREFLVQRFHYKLDQYPSAAFSCERASKGRAWMLWNT